MKTKMQKMMAAFLVVVMVLSLSACGKKAPEGLWKDATYTENTTLGEGAKTFTMAVEMEEKSITLTVNTDAGTVGEALLAHGVIAGDEGPYGLYIKTVNGVRADYDKDGFYWAFYVGEDYAMQGIELTPIEEGAAYRLVYAR